MREGRAEIIMESKSVFIAGSTYVADDFDMKDFTHIRAYHGCRPLDIGTYQAKGICSITYEDAKQELLDRFQNSNISPKRLLEVFEKHWEDLKDIQKGVWFTLTKKELLEESGHYLIAGSEFLLSIATELFCQYELRKVGTPTILCCDVPVNLISPFWLKTLQQAIETGSFNPCGFKISGPLPAEDIINMEFPTRIKDPHNGYRTYHIQ